MDRVEVLSGTGTAIPTALRGVDALPKRLPREGEGLQVLPGGLLGAGFFENRSPHVCGYIHDTGITNFSC